MKGGINMAGLFFKTDKQTSKKNISGISKAWKFYNNYYLFISMQAAIPTTPL